MLDMLEETIFAKATAPGGALRGIIRIAGPAAVRSIRTWFEPEIDAGRRGFAQRGNLYPWGAAYPVPATLLYWPAGRGYTGDETVEIHTWGAPPILQAAMAAIGRHEGVRLAKPGEFTLRAFLSGRLDLTQAEAVLGVIDADSEKKLEVSLRQLAGGIASPLKEIRESLFDLLVRLEAGLDFAEEDVEFVAVPEIRRILAAAAADTESLFRRMRSRALSDEMPRVVLAGPPNAGKSTLYNALLGRDLAIVSPEAGTTRDYLETKTMFDGAACILTDTAGRDGTGPDGGVDAAAREHAVETIERADLVVYCSETSDEAETPGTAIPPERLLRVRTKIDLVDENGMETPGEPSLGVSSKTGRGIDSLRRAVGRRLRAGIPGDEVVPGTALRCRDALDTAAQSLRRSLDATAPDEPAFDESLLAAEIRVAINALGLVDGTVHADDVLDRIFERFCIGK